MFKFYGHPYRLLFLENHVCQFVIGTELRLNYFPLLLIKRMLEQIEPKGGNGFPNQVTSSFDELTIVPYNKIQQLTHEIINNPQASTRSNSIHNYCKRLAIYLDLLLAQNNASH